MLCQILEINKELNSLIEKRNEVRSRLTSGIRNYEKHGTGGGDPHAMDQLVIIQDNIDRKFDELLKLQADLLQRMYSAPGLNCRERSVILVRYFQNMTIEKTAESVDLSYQQTKRILKKIEEVLENG